MIPKLVIQTFGRRELPPKIASVRDEMIARNPDYVFQLFDDADIADFINDAYGAKTLTAYHSIDPRYGAARADFFRYLSVYARGGIYLDIKSSFSKPIDEVLQADDEYIISQWRNQPGDLHAGFGLHRDLADLPGGEFQQWHVIAREQHPFLEAVIERVLGNIAHYSSWRFGVGRIGVQRVTGPIAYTRAILPILDTASYRRVPDETALSLHYSIAEGYSHLDVFKSHYSLHRHSIVRVPFQRQPAEAAYRAAQRLRAWLRP